MAPDTPVRMYRVTEAAVIAGVTSEEVNRAIDEDILPHELYAIGDGERRMSWLACTFVRFYRSTRSRITAAERRYVFSTVLGNIDKEHFFVVRFPARGRLKACRHHFVVSRAPLSFDLFEDASAVTERAEELEEARNAVVSDPEILGGTPVFKGTRIPVHDVAAAVSSGDSASRIKATYPALTPALIKLAPIYAKAYPRRGRPPRLSERTPTLKLRERKILDPKPVR